MKRQKWSESRQHRKLEVRSLTVRQDINCLVVDVEEATETLADSHERPVTGVDMRIELEMTRHVAPSSQQQELGRRLLPMHDGLGAAVHARPVVVLLTLRPVRVGVLVVRRGRHRMARLLVGPRRQILVQRARIQERPRKEKRRLFGPAAWPGDDGLSREYATRRGTTISSPRPRPRPRAPNGNGDDVVSVTASRRQAPSPAHALGVRHPLAAGSSRHPHAIRSLWRSRRHGNRIDPTRWEPEPKPEARRRFAIARSRAVNS